MVIETFFHTWERRLAAATKDRVIRPFEWGLDWVPRDGHPPDAEPATVLTDWTERVMEDTAAFFDTPPTEAWTLTGNELSFPSAYATPHPENNVARARLFPAAPDEPRLGAARAAVIVLPQWNAGPEAHVGLCRVLARSGLTALRLVLPYHERRMPPELHRADYIVSANVRRTVQVCRQAVVDARRAAHWLAAQGFNRIGILGTSLGSCLAMLTAAHEPLLTAAALNHVSPYFADVVWEGLSTMHVRAGLEGHIDLDRLRTLWLPISPWPYIDRLRGKRVLLVYARYDLTFPVTLSQVLANEFGRRGVPHELAVLPCGHYSTGVAPFSWMDGYVLTRFLRRSLLRTID